ncbi:MAG: hypothetical protein JXA73_18565 [Acidobacteria bacterium]|nr:hypothetical protein [Acidobacteriota bacterium]
MMEFQPTTKEFQALRMLVLCAIVILREGFDIQAAVVSATKRKQVDIFGNVIGAKRAR